MPDLLPDKLTPVSKQEALDALYAGWLGLFGKAPENENSLRVLMSQWALETGWGKAMHDFNFGNVKSVPGDGYNYCEFRCYELVDGKTVWYDPPNPATRFRAFATVNQGAEDYLKTLHQRFAASWPAVLSGDPAKFSQALHQQGYYTASEQQYTATLVSIFNGLKSLKIDTAKAPKPNPKPAADPSSPPPAPKPQVLANVTDGIGAAAARVALTRSLSAHGWTLDGGAAWTLTDPQSAPGVFHATKLLPGDTITICTSTGPRAGRVGTVILAQGEYADSGSVWLASASGPVQQVIIEQLKLEAAPRDFDASLKVNGKPVNDWRENEPRPAEGSAWVVGLVRTSLVQRSRVDAMTDAQRSAVKISKGDVEVTPGTVLSRSAKQRPGDATVQEIPIVAAPKVATKDKSKNASAAPLVQKAPLTGAANDDLPPPIQIDAHTVQVRIGNHAGRVGFTVKKPPAPLATTPASSTAQAPTADGKRDAFIQAAMNLLGTRYLANSADAAKGLDGVGLISICLRRVGALAKDAPELTADGLNAMFQHHGGTADKVPDDILPGDIAWFGTGTHDVDAQQHPMIFLGGSRVVGPIPDAGPNGGAVQVIHIKDVPEHFAGWAHIEDLGTATVHTEHPGEAPKSDKVVSGALLPAGPSIRYDALKQLAADKKAPWFDDKGKVNLIGVKNLHDRAVILPEEDGWNDTIFAAYLDDDGNKCCIELRASVNPGTDKNRAETWQLIDGGYKFKLAPGDGLSIQTLQPDGEVKGWFDEHGAGALRPGELRAAAESGKKPA